MKSFRDKVIDRLKELLKESGYEGVGSEEFLTFSQPTTNAEIDALTDEQLIEVLETHGMFEG